MYVKPLCAVGDLLATQPWDGIHRSMQPMDMGVTKVAHNACMGCSSAQCSKVCSVTESGCLECDVIYNNFGMFVCVLPL